jgi:hypothetical protein
MLWLNASLHASAHRRGRWFLSLGSVPHLLTLESDHACVLCYGRCWVLERVLNCCRFSIQLLPLRLTLDCLQPRQSPRISGGSLAASRLVSEPYAVDPVCACHTVLVLHTIVTQMGSNRLAASYENSVCFE